MKMRRYAWPLGFFGVIVAAVSVVLSDRSRATDPAYIAAMAAMDSALSDQQLGLKNARRRFRSWSKFDGHGATPAAILEMDVDIFVGGVMETVTVAVTVAKNPEGVWLLAAVDSRS